MLRQIKKMFNTEKSVRLTLFNIISLTVVALGIPSMLIMIIGQYGYSQLPAMATSLIVVVISIIVANVYKKLNLAASIIILGDTVFLFPFIFFAGGGPVSGMPSFFLLGTVFLFMLVDGIAFYILLLIQILAYTSYFYLAYIHPEWVIPLGDTKDIYVDIFQCLIIVGIAIGVINKFQTKQYEQIIKKAKAQNEALIESEKMADQANRAKSEFLSNMSHEIRTPINAIIGMNEMIRREADDKDVLGYADVVNSSAKALLAIINDILDFSKIESGKMTILEERYDLFSLVNDSYNMIHDRAKDKGLKLEIECDEHLPAYLTGDLIRIRQIIVNIMTNAVKYTHKGTVTLSVSGDRKDDNSIDLKISVKDTGIGMKKEDMDRLFGKFERFDLEHNQTVEGTGLGLTIVKSLVSLMKGEVFAESEYGKGSTFTVIIPQKISGTEEIGKAKFGINTENIKPLDYSPSIVQADSSVLVVDDVKMNLLVFKKLIKQTEIMVDTAMSGKECLEMISKKKYDIIFMDHMMPEMNGIETFKRLKADSSHMNTDTPVVMLTANAIAGMDEEYRKFGFADYISKPIDVSRLEEILRSYIKND